MITFDIYTLMFCIFITILIKYLYMNISLIPATETDRAFFRQVHHEAYRETIESMFVWDDAEQDRFADTDFDNRIMHIVMLGEERCGVVGHQDQGDHIELGPIYILPVYQNKGIGSGIVKLYIQKATDQKAQLKLKTLRTNTRAKELYERLGFTVSDQTEQYWFMNYK
jgi:GNAT superfamily N-acetyltransferase